MNLLLNYEEENCSANRIGGRGKEAEESRANKAAWGPASQTTAAASVQFVYGHGSPAGLQVELA